MWLQNNKLMYDDLNLNETVRYCRTHNRVLRDLSDSDIKDRFFGCIMSAAGGALESSGLQTLVGKLEPVYNAWFLIDPAPTAHLKSLPEENTASHFVHFYVRMGRLPALDAVPDM